jgi:hypothetical protein
MMAPKLSGDAVLGGHHLYVTPRTMTGKIRTTAGITMPRIEDAEAGPAYEMATVVMISRQQDNRMWAGKSISQINSFAHRNKSKLCKESRDTGAAERILHIRDTLPTLGGHLTF